MDFPRVFVINSDIHKVVADVNYAHIAIYICIFP